MRKILFTASICLSLNLANAAVLATVNGKDITDTELNKRLEQVLAGKSINSLPAEQKRMLIQQYIAQYLIIEDAKKKGYEKDKLYSENLELAKESILMGVYQQKLAELNTNYELLKSRLKREDTISYKEQTKEKINEIICRYNKSLNTLGYNKK